MALIFFELNATVRRLADLLLGKELAAEVYGPLPLGSEPTYLGTSPLTDG